jgi:hypothetical protein
MGAAKGAGIDSLPGLGLTAELGLTIGWLSTVGLTIGFGLGLATIPGNGVAELWGLTELGAGVGEPVDEIAGELVGELVGEPVGATVGEPVGELVGLAPGTIGVIWRRNWTWRS